MWNQNEEGVKRRVLKKVRRQHLNKTPEENDENHVEIPPTPEQMTTDGTIRLIEPSIGLIEQNRQIKVGLQFLNTNYCIDSISIESQSSTKAVNLHLQLNYNFPPKEYMVKRLESFGDLELATLAHRIKTYMIDYPGIIGRFYEIIGSQYYKKYSDHKTQRAKAIDKCKEIESKYAYLKVLLFSNKEDTFPISISVNEEFTKEVGHDLESFIAEIKENGVPTTMLSDCCTNLQIGKLFFESNDLKEIIEIPEFNSLLNGKDGKKKEVRLQLISVQEVTEEGIFRHGYMVVKNEQKDENFHKEETTTKLLKQIKYETVKTSDEVKQFKEKVPEEPLSKEQIIDVKEAASKVLLLNHN